MEDRFEGLSIAPAVKAAIGFGLVGIIGTAYPQVLGVGYDRMQEVFYEHVPAIHALALAVLKPLATWLTIGSGGSGGVFSLTLFTGAMLGDPSAVSCTMHFPPGPVRQRRTASSPWPPFSPPPPKRRSRRS